MKSFPEQLAEAQAALEARVHGGAKPQPLDRTLAHDLYQSGYAVGLTSKEITKVLVKAVIAELRPGLARS